ncbi:hypothetical protein KI387_010310, partial [Taxus chinensis]
MVKESPIQKLHTTGKQHFKGVRMRKWGKWVSEVRMPNSRGRIWLGSYDSPQQAARAYDCAAYCLRGSKATFNFPNSLPEIPLASSPSPAQIQALAANFAVEEFRRPPQDNPEFTGSESQPCVDNQQFVEEEESIVLDSLVEDVESKQSLNLEEFQALDDIGFLFMEGGGGVPLHQTDDLWEFESCFNMYYNILWKSIKCQQK